MAFERFEDRLALAIDADVWVDSGQVMTGGFDHDREGLPGATVPYQQVFAYQLGEDPAQPFRASDPGFNSAPVLPQSYRLTISIAGGLQYWSGAGQPSFAPVTAGLELNLRNRLANWNQRVGASTSSSSALVIQTVPANRQVHRHLDASIGTGGSGETFGTNGAAPGVYAFSVRLGLDPGSTGQPPIDQSLPIYYVVSLGASAAAWNAGRDHFRDLAIGKASMSLAVDDGVSPIDGITTNGRINVGSLNPRATKEFSVNGGSTWSPLASTGFFVVNAGTYAAGALQVRQTIVDHHGTRATIGSNATAFTVVASDTVAPTVMITSNRSTLAAGQTSTIGFTMSEPVTGFTAADVVVTGGSLSGFTGSGTSYTATFTPLANTVTTGTV
ncbi:MAG: Ig-like domain-containing protein, partial [Planctomycetia bacterium]